MLGIKCVSFSFFFSVQLLCQTIFAPLDFRPLNAGDVRKSVSRLCVQRSLFFCTILDKNLDTYTNFEETL